MANIHHLFFSTDADKQTLHRRIVPNEEQRQLQQERWGDLRDFLVSELREVSGYEISSWLQGSYKFGTQVRPADKFGEFDIDLGIYFNWFGVPDDGNFSPRNLKDFVQETLVQYQDEAKGDTEVISPPKERCSRIRFPNNFHIDVPVYHLDRQRDARALATESGVWENSDPKALYVWFQEKFADDDSSQVRRLIRYLKIWAALHFKKPPSSVLLTVLAAEAYLQLGENDLDGDDVALRNLAEVVADRMEYDSEVLNPVDDSENLNRLSDGETDTLKHMIRKLVETADKALAAPTEFAAAAIWSEAFHQFFHIPAEQESSGTTNNVLVPVKFVPEVHVRAIPKNNSHNPYTEVNSIGPIPRGCRIYFTLSNADSLPQGARVNWVVRNEGEEAEYTNDLGHLAGEDPRHSEENSSYKGTHYMDVIVSSVLGEILGFRRVPVVISGTFMPPRNPKKPGYTRIRPRR